MYRIWLYIYNKGFKINTMNVYVEYINTRHPCINSYKSFADQAMMGLTMMAASASAAIVYLAHNGNSSSNWLPVCQQFGDFCQGTSGAVVASFIAAALLMFLVVLSAFALKRST